MLGKPDIVFVAARVAVFVDGDYWHGNAWRIRGYADFDAYYRRGANGAFWAAKIRRNVERDRHVTNSLQDEGWHVVRVWETDIKTDLVTVVDQIELSVRKRAA